MINLAKTVVCVAAFATTLASSSVHAQQKGFTLSAPAFNAPSITLENSAIRLIKQPVSSLIEPVPIPNAYTSDKSIQIPTAKLPDPSIDIPNAYPSKSFKLNFGTPFAVPVK